MISGHVRFQRKRDLLGDCEALYAHAVRVNEGGIFQRSNRLRLAQFSSRRGGIRLSMRSKVR